MKLADHLNFRRLVGGDGKSRTFNIYSLKVARLPIAPHPQLMEPRKRFKLLMEAETSPAYKTGPFGHSGQRGIKLVSAAGLEPAYS